MTASLEARPPDPCGGGDAPFDPAQPRPLTDAELERLERLGFTGVVAMQLGRCPRCGDWQTVAHACPRSPEAARPAPQPLWASDEECTDFGIEALMRSNTGVCG